MRRPLILLLVLALAAPILGTANVGEAGEYRPKRAGHPVRIAAYVLHPVGYILDRLIFYPIWAIGQHEWVGPLFGVKRTVRDVVLEEDKKPLGRHPNVLIEIGPALPPEPQRQEPDQP